MASTGVNGKHQTFSFSHLVSDSGAFPKRRGGLANLVPLLKYSTKSYVKSLKLLARLQ